MSLTYQKTLTNWWIYIIYSPSLSKYYYGITTLPEKRIKAHRRGRNPSTKSAADWTYVDKTYIGDFETAHACERYMRKNKVQTTLDIDTVAAVAWAIQHPRRVQ